MQCASSGIPYTWTRTDDFVHTGMYRHVLVCGSTAFHVLVCTGIYRYVRNSNYQNMVYTGTYRIKVLMVFISGGVDFRSIHGGIHFSRTAQHILVLQVQNNPFYSKLCTKNVYTGTLLYIQVYTVMYAYTQRSQPLFTSNQVLSA